MLKLKFQYVGHSVKSRLIRKDPYARKDWGQEEKGVTGWDVWVASQIQWTWVWANSGRWWRTGKPGMLPFMGLQRVGQDLATDQQQQLPLQVTVRFLCPHGALAWAACFPFLCPLHPGCTWRSHFSHTIVIYIAPSLLYLPNWEFPKGRTPTFSALLPEASCTVLSAVSSLRNK